MNIIQENSDAIQELCHKHHVKSLVVFGSVLTEQFNPESDVDFLVEFEGMDLASYADNYFNLKEALENLLSRSIDLLEKQAVQNPYLMQSIEQNQSLIYG
jgi:predicted nucleotidyltransferase